jgi:hypothetical protein
MKTKYKKLVEESSNLQPPGVITGWRGMVSAWDEDHSKPDPYEAPESGQSIENSTTITNHRSRSQPGYGSRGTCGQGGPADRGRDPVSPQDDALDIYSLSAGY